MKSIEQIKNEVAVKHGYESFEFMLNHLYSGESQTIDINDIVSEAMQEYAKQMCDEQIKACASELSNQIYEHGFHEQSILNTPNVVK